MNMNGFEIERKYLIAMPEENRLAEASASDIVQTYLSGEEGTTERVRVRVFDDHTEYTHTTKRRLTAIRRLELEDRIGRETYEQLLCRADPARNPIEKRRFCLSFEGNIIEIDVYPFWEEYAIMEIELVEEKQPFSLPPWIRVIREVTDDPRFTNSALSLKVPDPAAE